MPNEFPNPAGYIRPFRPTDLQWLSVWEEAAALLLLNLPDQALPLLEPGPGKVHSDAGMESLRLLVMEQMGRPSTEIATDALEALAVHGPTRQLTDMASLHLACSERYPELLHLFGRFEGQFEFSALSLHNIAIAAAHLAFYQRALEIIFQVAPNYKSSWELLLDSQLLCLWRHYAECCPSLHEARLLTSNAARGVLKEVREHPPMKNICEYTLRRSLPASLRPHMVRTISGHYELDLDTPPEMRQKFRQWSSDRRHLQLRLASRALHQAKEVIKPLRTGRPILRPQISPI